MSEEQLLHSKRAKSIGPFASYLLSQGLITETGLDEALAFQNEFQVPLHQAVLRLGLARERDLLKAVSEFFGLPLFEQTGLALPDLTQMHSTLARLSLTANWAGHKAALFWITNELEGEGETLLLLAKDPVNSSLLEEFSRRWDGPIRIMLAPNVTIERSLGALQADARKSDDLDDVDRGARLRELAEEAPVIDFVNRLFSEALELDASDVHIEPGPDAFETRFRVDGVLSHTRRNPKSMFDPVCTRIKILSGMDISERRLPQDGRQSIRTAGEDIDLRVSSLPATYGESIVIRMLRKRSSLPDLEGLGFEGKALNDLRNLVGLPNGVILVTGPTGSGKSTTLYRSLELLNDGKRKIITIEDPVEYDIEGINQVQAHPEIGLTFASGLRSILRQDPDIIMVGEIRDQETAVIAIQSALTGHLVFSTLHTNSALGAIERMQDLGVEPFLITAALRGVIGQRLLRRLCSECCKPQEDVSAINHILKVLHESKSPVLQHLKQSFHEPVGCAACGQTGYRGRVGVFEVVNFQAPVFQKMGGAPVKPLDRDTLRDADFISMVEDGILKASFGETSLEEIERVFGKGYDRLGF